MTQDPRREAMFVKANKQNPIGGVLRTLFVREGGTTDKNWVTINKQKQVYEDDFIFRSELLFLTGE